MIKINLLMAWYSRAKIKRLSSICNIIRLTLLRFCFFLGCEFNIVLKYYIMEIKSSFNFCIRNE
ncbi:hypothetical protein X921_02520 [Borreliella garinii SZ]|nr:hypothetical protein X921_02520 [Borreliella garinii SZ]